jgi:type IV secretion system protein TrbG
MRTPSLVLAALMFVGAAHAADNKPIVPSINDIVTLPTIDVSQPPAQGFAPISPLSPPTDQPAMPDRLFPADLMPPISHAKSPQEIASDKVFDAEKDAYDIKQRARIAEYIGNATQRPTAARSSGSTTVYSYREGQIYLAYAGLDRLTDIQLEPGETLTADPIAGDTEGWIKAQFTSGSGPTALTHIVVKPRDEGIETNLIVPTNKRVYQLDLRAKPDWYMPAVRWFYPEEETAAMAKKELQEKASEASSEALAVSAEHLNFHYKVKGHDVPWKPTQVFDDGTKVYLKMPDSMTTTDAPALFVVENGQPLLVNYRVKDRLYIIDRLFDAAQLRVGTKQTIDVERCTEHSWFCR